MAERKVFFANEGRLWSERSVNFEWAPGMSKKQRQLSLQNLNDVIGRRFPGKTPLDISRYSLDPLGAKLSAFNLMLTSKSGDRMSVECAYQGSKVLYKHGKLDDLYHKTSMEAKKDPRLKDALLLKFEFEGEVYDGTFPRTCFYNMLYVRVLMENPELADHLMEYDTFTDIMFSAEKSSSCQAEACAIYVSLRRKGLLEEAIASKEAFKRVVYGQ